ncbi:tripartite motif-containing protein 16-like isoform X3 [Pygocentrus nattereri]|uniref:tripartite motif-containing protein 16-like isoform X3 n=1 Tax=Pygocentrus nattereri TaxID=42514 RepID=UPI0018918EE7|nr:tripartite motif-containing protein 16-like isoform X3 [Pygocentrus nattereri]
MAEASISVDQDQFSCPVCLDLLKDPVAIPCGHSFCMVCINRHWDQEDQRRVYSCPQCRETFTLRPVLRRNYFIAEMVEKVKKPELQAASPAHCYAGPGDVECDFCTRRKLKAIKSCLVCLASYCETHVQSHYQSPAFKKHQLVKASSRLQEKICSQHDKLMEIYCRTDQSCICYLCTMHEHKGHDTVAAAAERTEKQNLLEEVQRKSQQRLQQKEKKLQELKQAVVTLKRSAQAAVEDSERIFTELIRSIEKKRSEVTKLIRTQEKNQLRQTEELLENLQQEIDDLKRRNTELEQLSVTEDHIQFLQSFQSLSVSAGCEDSSSFTVHQHPSFDGVRKSLSDLKERLEEFCKEEFRKISPHAAAVQTISSSEPRTREDFLQSAAVQTISSSEPRTREDFLQYFCPLTLDPNTVHHQLILSEQNRLVKWRGGGQRYSDHPERFDHWYQVLCKESLSGRCYWEVEWRRGLFGFDMVFISVLYKGISRKGRSNESEFGCNNQSWSLRCSSSLSFWHNNIETELSAPSSSRIGVYVDHRAGTLSFYSVSDTLTLLHTVHTTFTQPLYAGFGLGLWSSAKLCDSVMKLK